MSDQVGEGSARQGRAGGRQLRTPTGARKPVRVYLTETQMAALSDRAAQLGVSASAFLAASVLGDREALGHRIVTPDERRALAEVFELRRLLATIANNVNQLAHVANMERETPSEQRLLQLADEVGDVLGRLRDVTDGVR